MIGHLGVRVSLIAYPVVSIKKAPAPSSSSLHGQTRLWCSVPESCLVRVIFGAIFCRTLACKELHLVLSKSCMESCHVTCMVTFVCGKWNGVQRAVMCSLRFRSGVMCELCSLIVLSLGRQRAVMCIRMVLLSEGPHLLGALARKKTGACDSASLCCMCG